MQRPLVTVICLCYNHERFVTQAVESVLKQSYPSIQLIIVDDASTDGSVPVIQGLLQQRHDITFIGLKENVRNCRAFNIGLAQAKGKYIVDLSADDVFHSERIEKQVRLFEQLGPDYGVVFTDAEFIDDNGASLGKHFANLFRRKLIDHIPEGDVYRQVLRRYFISAPTMLVRKEAFDALQGYDENLAYEDFDFWVRSSREFKYAAIDEALTFVRRTKNSLSSKLYQPGDKQLHSTYLVCEKAFGMNRTPEEMMALAERIRYEMKHAVITNNMSEAKLFYELLQRTDKPRWLDEMLMKAGRALPMKKIRRWLLQ